MTAANFLFYENNKESTFRFCQSCVSDYDEWQRDDRNDEVCEIA